MASDALTKFKTTTQLVTNLVETHLSSANVKVVNRLVFRQDRESKVKQEVRPLLGMRLIPWVPTPGVEVSLLTAVKTTNGTRMQTPPTIVTNLQSMIQTIRLQRTAVPLDCPLAKCDIKKAKLIISNAPRIRSRSSTWMLLTGIAKSASALNLPESWIVAQAPSENLVAPNNVTFRTKKSYCALPVVTWQPDNRLPSSPSRCPPAAVPAQLNRS